MKSLFKINIFTYLFFLLLILSGHIKDGITIYIILILHAIGHIIIMKLLNIEIYSVTIYPYGGIIKSNILINTNSYKILLISLGGILIQLILYVIVYFIFKINFISNNFYTLFITYNTSIILFNILPMIPLDGSKILLSILELIFPFRLSIYILLSLNFIFLISFIFFLIYLKITNYIIIIFLIISLLYFIKNIKYLFNKFYLERIIYNIKFNGLISIDSIKKIYKNKKNYINSINEKEYLTNFYKYML